MSRKNQHGRGDRQWEADLHARHLAGDRSATEELYLAHDRAVCHIACKFADSWRWDRDEAIGAARLAFLQVLEKFDPSKARLITLLYLAIPRNLRACRNRDRVIPVSSGYNGERHKQHDHAQRALACGSLDAAGDWPHPVDESDPAAAAEQADLVGVLLAAMERLDDRDAEVLRQRYFGGAKHKDIGASLGVSKARAQQLEARAIKRLCHDIVGRGVRNEHGFCDGLEDIREVLRCGEWEDD